MTDSSTDNGPDMTDTLSVTEAAARLGVSERTVWRRIKQGKLTTQKAIDGVRVVLSVVPAEVSDTAPVNVSDTTDKATDTVSVEQAGDVARALEVIERMHQAQADELERLRRDNQQLAGQVGYLQRQVLEQQDTIQRLLMAPKELEPEPAPEVDAAHPRAWWQIWRR